MKTTNMTTRSKNANFLNEALEEIDSVIEEEW